MATNRTLNTRIQNKYAKKSEWEKDNSAASKYKPLEGELIIYAAEYEKQDDEDVLASRPRIKVGQGESAKTIPDLPYVGTVVKDVVIEGAPQLMYVTSAGNDSTSNAYKYTYNENIQQIYLDNSTKQSWYIKDYDPSKMYVSGGTLSAKNAGDYTIEITAHDGYCFSDGENTKKTIELTWSIRKKVINVGNQTTVELKGKTSETIITIKDTSNKDIPDEMLVECKYDGSTDSVVVNFLSFKNQLKLTRGNTNGTAILNITIHKSDNYGFSSTDSEYVDNTDSQTVTLEIKADSSLNSYTWAEIDQISRSGQARNYFNIGDRKALDEDNKDKFAYIIGIDHNSAYEGTGIHFSLYYSTFAEYACYAEWNPATQGNYGKVCSSTTNYIMNLAPDYNATTVKGDNSGGWKSCSIRYTILGSTDSNKGSDASNSCATSPVENTIMSTLPKKLRTVMKPMIKYTDNVAGNTSRTLSNITKTIDYLPLLSEFEVWGPQDLESTYANLNEKNFQGQYEWFRAGNTKNRKASMEVNVGPDVVWWLRSPSACSDAADHNRPSSTSNAMSYTFCCVGVRSGGTLTLQPSHRYSSVSLGICPIFKV